MNKSIKILYIDDAKSDQELVNEAFKNDSNNFELIIVSNRNDFEENLKKYSFDLVLSDFNILGMDGFQVLDIVRSINEFIPIVVITGTGSEESAVELMKRGISDYVIKTTSHIKKLPSIIISILEKENLKLEQKKNQRDLEISLKKYKVLFESFPLGITITDADGKIIESNLKSEKLLGISKNEATKRRYDSKEWKIVRPDGSLMPPEEYASVEALTKNRLIENQEAGIVKTDEEITWINVTAAPIPLEGYGVAIAYNDISKNKIIEKRKDLALQILELLNNTKEKTGIIQKILSVIKNLTAFEAVGIRLKQGDDYPYSETIGFTNEFVEIERSLCLSDSNGKIICDSSGKPYLECMCGNVISQRTDSLLPFFTAGGSFWINSTTELLKNTTDKERQTKTRNYCNNVGYESVALVPLKSENEIIGLLQFNDHRKNMFNADMIIFFESIANSIGIAIARKRIEDSLRISNTFNESLLRTIPFGMEIVDMDGIVLFINPALESVVGREVLGKKCWEIYKDNKIQCELCPLKTGIEIGETRSIETSCVLNGKIFEITHTGMIYQDKKTILEVFYDITERRRAEESLITAHSRLNKAMKLGKLAWWEMNCETGEVIFSELKAKMLGFPKEKFNHYSDFTKLLHPDDLEPAMQAMRDHLSGDKKNYTVDYRIETSSGEYKWFHDIGGITKRNQDGKPLIVIGMVVDITERKNTEEALRKSELALLNKEERLRLALEATSDGLWDNNLKTGEMYWSSRYYTMLGYEPDEFLPNFENFKKLIHPDDIDNVLSNLNLEGKNDKLQYEVTYRMRSKNHEWRWISNRFKIVKKGNDELPERVIGTITDITKSKHYEEDLKRKNRALKVLSGCNEIIVKAKEEKILIENICQKIVEIGGYALAWVGIAKDDERKSVLPVAWAGNEDGYLKTVNISWAATDQGKGPTGTAIRTGKPYIVRDIRTDQNFIPWLGQAIKRGYQSVISLPLVDNIHVFGALSIYSAEMNAFDKNELELLSELANDLSYGINSIRTKEMHNELQEQFLQSQKMEAIGKLAGGIAHDFNNILTVIMGNTDLILSDIDDSKNILIWAQKVKTSTKKASSLTHQLLAFSRKQMIQPKILDLNTIVNEAQKLFYRLIGEDIDLILNLQTGLKRIEADPGQIDQIIMNLVVNARDAMPNGGNVIIKTENMIFTQDDMNGHPDGSSGEFVCLTISDTGIGIKDDIKSKIFDPFFTTKELGKGTGLGLSVVYGIVKQNKGWIEIETEVGNGASFKIFLPGFDSKVDEVEAHNDSGSKYMGQGEKIIVVEDDPDIRNLIQNTLSSHGYSVQQSKNTKDALNIFIDNGGKFDMAFLDIVLPDGSGIELFEKLLVINPDIKVLFSSGYADEKAKWSIIQEKHYDFLQKPYENLELLKAVKRTLNEKSDDMD